MTASEPASATTWKVGPLAAASGLTVRTLHHWDTIGLLSPSRRTAGGHREYDGDDVARLYQVLALRSLGLGLETITVCLDRGVDPVRLVHDHLGRVEASIAALDDVRRRLVRLGEELAGDETPSTTSLLDALRALGRTGPESEGALGRHLDACARAVRRSAPPRTTCWRSNGPSSTAGPRRCARPASRPRTRGCGGWWRAWTS